MRHNKFAGIPPMQSVKNSCLMWKDYHHKERRHQVDNMRLSMAGQQRRGNGQAARGEIVAHGAHFDGRAGKAMDEQATRGATRKLEGVWVQVGILGHVASRGNRKLEMRD